MSYLGNSPTTTAFVTDQFSGTGSQTVFTMSVAPATTSSIIVAVTGVLQDPSTYSVSGTTLTFSAAPPTGTGNISVRYLGIPASGVTTTAYRTVTEFTATAGQTTFSVPSYTVGYIDVYRNGVRLGTADFTATNGTTVVLASAATAGDLVTTESFYVSSVINAIPATAGAVNSTYITDAAVTQAKLASGVAGNGPAFMAHTSIAQSIANNTITKVQFNVEDFDTNGCYDNTTNYRFTPNVAGYYQVNILIQLYSANAGVMYSQLYKNGSSIMAGPVSAFPAVANEVGSNLSIITYMNGTTDYLEAYIRQSSGGSITVDQGGWSNFSACMVRAA